MQLQNDVFYDQHALMNHLYRAPRQDGNAIVSFSPILSHI